MLRVNERFLLFVEHLDFGRVEYGRGNALHLLLLLLLICLEDVLMAALLHQLTLLVHLRVLLGMASVQLGRCQGRFRW